MKSFKFFLSVLAIVVLGQETAMADHEAAGDLTYKCLGNNQYEITFTMYRDCAGASGKASDFKSTITSGSCGTVTPNFTEVSRSEIAYPCPTAQTNCSGGTVKALQAIVFKATVTLSPACKDWVIKITNGSNRNCAITTTVACGGFFGTCNGACLGLAVSDSMFNISCNNSPVFINKPVLYACVGQPFCFNAGATDPDGDSLVYMFTPPLSTGVGSPPQVINGQIQYVAPYSYTNFLSSSTPITINRQTGEVCFTPTKIEVTIAAVRILEFRNGLKVGSTERDMEIWVINCNNNLPTATGINGTTTYSITACAGQQLCFTVNTNDADAGQVVTAIATSSIPGATFTTAGSPHPTGTFCWTPQSSDVRGTPYQLTLLLNDDNCPLRGTQQATYAIYVQQCGFTVSVPNDTICPGQCALLTPSISLGTPPYSYNWSPGGISTSTLSPCPSANTTYTITVTDATSASASAIATVMVSSPPNISTAATSICPGGTSTLTASGASTYTWSAGTNPVTGATVSASPAATTTYTVTGTNTAGCTNRNTVAVTVTTPPVIIASNMLLCKDSTGSLSASGAAGNSYTWSPATGLSSSIGSPVSVSKNATGVYNYTVTGLNGCTASTSVAVTVNDCSKPVITISGNTICGGGCTDLLANVSGGVGPYTYAWTPVLPANAGPHNICPTTTTSYTLIVTDSKGDADTAIAVVTTIPLPVITVNSISVCKDSLATLSASGCGSYTWMPGNFTGSTYTVIPTSLGSVTYTISCSLSGCTSSTQAGITANDCSVPTVSVTGGSICAGSCFTLNAQATGTPPLSYTWIPNAGSTASVQVCPSVTTTYTVIVSDNKGATSAATATVTINLLPNITAGNATICSGNAATLTATGGSANNYTWLPSSGSVQTGSSITLNPASAVTYTVIGRDANGCINTTLSTVTVNPLPSVTAIGSAVCQSSSAVLNASGALNYVWMPGAGSGSTYTVTPSATTTYTVTGIDANNCSASAVATVTVSLIPVVTVNSPSVCSGSSAVLTASGAALYSWSTGASTNSITVNPSQTTTYTVTGINAGACSNSATAVITVSAIPVVGFAPDTSGCVPLTVNFINNSIGPIQSVCEWYYGDGSKTINNCQPSHTYTKPGSYAVKLIVTTQAGCRDSLTIPNMINVYALPVADFTASPWQTEIMEPNITFTNKSTGDSAHAWTFGDGTSDNTALNPIEHIYEDTGTYNVCLSVVNATNCQDSICHTIIIKPVWSFYIPNAFTPNGDGKNESFNGKGENIKEYTLYVYDRWGNLLFESNSMDKGWDGRANEGTDIAQEDVYVYIVKFIDVHNKKHQYAGSVTLVK